MTIMDADLEFLELQDHRKTKKTIYQNIIYLADDVYPGVPYKPILDITQHYDRIDQQYAGSRSRYSHFNRKPSAQNIKKSFQKHIF